MINYAYENPIVGMIMKVQYEILGFSCIDRKSEIRQHHLKDFIDSN